MLAHVSWDREGLMLAGTGTGLCFSAWASSSIAQAHSVDLHSWLKSHLHPPLLLASVA